MYNGECIPPSAYDDLIKRAFRKPVRAVEIKNYTIDDIDWIGTRDEEVDIDEFLSLLKTFSMMDLDGFDQSVLGWHIIMKDGCWFEGIADWDYGCSYWKFHDVPARPTKKASLKRKEDIIGEVDD